MAKKFTSSSQQLKPDPKFGSKLVSKFINALMMGGKKSTAQAVFYDALDIIGKKITDALLKEAGEAASAEADPISDISASDEYRRDGETYVDPIFAYKHGLGFSVTGGITAEGAQIGASIGGSGGDGSKASKVTLTSTGEVVSTAGDHAYGILAQSIGGSGGAFK